MIGERSIPLYHLLPGSAWLDVSAVADGRRLAMAANIGESCHNYQRQQVGQIIYPPTIPSTHFNTVHTFQYDM